MGKPQYTGRKYTFSHPQLGDLTGRLVDSKHFPRSPVVQFRSIPYATVPKRFSPSNSLTEIPDGFDSRPHRDFTNFGAACPQIGPATPGFFEAYGGMLDDDVGVEYDEFACLTMTISVPEAHLTSDGTTKLPVMVYIHGGGGEEGIAHVDGLHSNAPITSYAASISKSVITVNIGYRLGWFGSLVCQDILDEFDALPPSNPHGPFNLSIQDQRNAFTWINNFIGGFGGDASNITAFGESAGSVFLTYHICGSTSRLFDRAILQSGLIFGDIPIEVKEVEYQAMLKHFDIQGSSASERLSSLRNIDAQALVQIPAIHLIPYMGPVPGVEPTNSLFSKGPATVFSQFELIATCDWLRDLMIGEDFWEGHVFFPLLKHIPQFQFTETVKTIFPNSDELLEAYGLSSSEALDPNLAWKQVSYFLGDLMFSTGYHMLTNFLSKYRGKQCNVYRYSFALSNPFPGSAHSFVAGHHFVEILYVFLTLLDRYPTHRYHWAARQAHETARRWILFANGERPWDPLTTSDDGTEDVGDARLAICDDLHGWTVRTLREDEEVSKNDPWGERRYAGWRAMAAAFESLKADSDDSVVHAQKIALAKLQIMKLAYGESRKLELLGQ